MKPERTYRIHVAAEFSGVRVELIRAWERRYGVVTPRRTASGYRVYTERDVALLRRLKQLTEEGVAISDAAAMLPQLLAEIDAAGVPAVLVAPEHPSASMRAWQEEILTAAVRMDQHRVAEVLERMMVALPPVRAFDEVLAPLQREVGERWHAGKLSVGQEHLVTQEVRARLIGLLLVAPQDGVKRAVMACFPEEQHEVGLLGAALRLRHAGFKVTLLGPRTAVEVGTVARALKADVVGLSAVVDPGAREFESTLVRVMEELRPGTALWLGGPVAVAYPDICKRLGVHVFQRAEDWARLLGG